MSAHYSIFAVLEGVHISALATPNDTRAKFDQSTYCVEILVSCELVIPAAVRWVPKLEKSNLRKESGNLHVKMLTGR